MKKQRHQSIAGNDSITEKLFRENETMTNRQAGDCLLAVAFLNAVFSIPISFNWVYTNSRWAGVVLFVCSFIEVALFARMKITGFESEKAKYFLFTGLIFMSGIIYFLYPLACIFLYCGPILVSIKYYDPRLTARVSVATWLMFLAAVTANIVLESVSPAVHDMHMEQGMMLWMEVPYTIKYYIIPKSGVYLIEGITACMIARSGKKLVKEQADITAKAVRMSTELSTAAEIQKSTLPDRDFITPDSRLTLSAQMRTARDVGGDFFDYFMLNDHLLVTIVADVSDKGLPAAMFAVEAQSYLRFAFFESVERNAQGEIEFVNLEKTLNAVNRQLAFHNMDGMFVTMWVGCFDTRTGAGKFVNAGHCCPFLLHEDGTVDTVRNEPQIFMGAFEDTELKSGYLRFGSGDTLVLYTDGATDARNDKDEMFGEDRLKALLASAAEHKGGTEPARIRAEVFRGLETFIGAADQYDDITVMEIHFDGAEPAQNYELAVMTGDACAGEVTDFVNRHLPENECPPEFIRNLGVVIDEICSNITENAYGDGSGPLSVDMALSRNYISLTFTDSGVPFDPTAWEEPDVDSGPRIGGLGIHLVRSLSDDMKYRYENGENNLTICKIWNM